MICLMKYLNPKIWKAQLKIFKLKEYPIEYNKVKEVYRVIMNMKKNNNHSITLLKASLNIQFIKGQ